LPLLQALIRVVSFFCFYFLLNAPKAFGARFNVNYYLLKVKTINL